MIFAPIQSCRSRGSTSRAAVKGAFLIHTPSAHLHAMHIPGIDRKMNPEHMRRIAATSSTSGTRSWITCTTMSAEVHHVLNQPSCGKTEQKTLSLMIRSSCCRHMTRRPTKSAHCPPSEATVATHNARRRRGKDLFCGSGFRL